MNKQRAMKTLRSGWKILLAVILGIMIGFVLHWGLSPIRAGGEEVAAASQTQADEHIAYWTCSMHPQVHASGPGLCPFCGMELIPVREGAEDGTSEMPRLSASPAAKALMNIKTAPVERKFVTAQIRMVGKVAYDETRVQYITAWVPGRLDRLFVDYTGVPVKKGDHMVYMYSPELLSAQEELIQALKTAQNIEHSQSSVIREVTAGTVQAAREKLRLLGLTEQQVEEIQQRGTPSDHITIYAPTSGIVIHKNAQEGMYVDTGTRIYTVADLSHVWVKLDAYESDLAWLRYGQHVQFTTVSFPGQVFEGTISFIDPILDAVTRTVKVRVDVPNPNGTLKPEMFVKAVVKAQVAAGGKVMNPDLAGKWICPMHPSVVKDQPGDCDICGMPLVRTESLGYVSIDPQKVVKPLVIPASAPLITGKRAVVYVEVPDAEKPTYEGREIVLGPRAGDYYIVESGLAEGEQVVTNGNFKIDSALQIQAKPSMMMPRGDGQEMTGRKQTEPPLTLSDASRRQIQTIFNVYFDMQQALYEDDFKAAAAAIAPLKNAIEQVDMTALSHDAHMIWMKHLQSLSNIVAGAEKADDIEKFRQAFSLLSEELFAIASRFGAPGTSPIYQLHCPMAFNNRGANWLQPDDDIRNPYFGPAMPTCGAVFEVIEPKSPEDTGDRQHD